MRSRTRLGLLFFALAPMFALALSAAGAAHAQKYGGVLHAILRENPPSLSIHEEATISTVWPMMPVYNNLVLYDWERPVESVDHLTGELAENWAWSDGGKKLTLWLRRGVRWHDDKPFTSADVKYTLDLLRGTGKGRLRLNPRKIWYGNIANVAVAGEYEVRILLKRPQPSLLSMLATGYTPIYPAHVDPDTLRTRPMGTGPFVFKEYVPGARIVLAKNPSYFVKGRPYLEGITYLVIQERPARAAALIAGQADIFFPQDGTPALRDQVKSRRSDIVVQSVAQSNSYNVLFNTRKPPFDNPKLRQAVNYSLDRAAFIKAQGGFTIPGGALVPPPYGQWGLPPEEMAKLPGWGDGAQDKARARALLAEAGYGPSSPLRVTLTTRTPATFTDMAEWMIAQLRETGIEATLEVVDTEVWYPRLARREFQFGANMTGTGPDDPDADFIENYTCGSPRNYSDFCSKELQAEMVASSQEQDPAKRLRLVQEIDRKLQIAGARPMLGHTLDFVLSWPYVKNFVPHNSLYNYGRMQNVWLDR